MEGADETEEVVNIVGINNILVPILTCSICFFYFKYESFFFVFKLPFLLFDSGTIYLFFFFII
jgi:hypothetical protein